MSCKYSVRANVMWDVLVPNNKPRWRYWSYSAFLYTGVPSTLRPYSHAPVFFRPVADRTGKSTTLTSPVTTGRSNDHERCDQAVVNAQWSAMDSNSIIAPFLLCRRRKRRRKGLHWIHPVIRKKGRIRCLLHTIWWITRFRKQVF